MTSRYQSHDVMLFIAAVIFYDRPNDVWFWLIRSLIIKKGGLEKQLDKQQHQLKRIITCFNLAWNQQQHKQKHNQRTSFFYY
jgi:hypothetical protein